MSELEDCPQWYKNKYGAIVVQSKKQLKLADARQLPCSFMYVIWINLRQDSLKEGGGGRNRVCTVYLG